MKTLILLCGLVIGCGVSAQTDTARVIMLLSDTSRFKTTDWQGNPIEIIGAPFVQWAFGYRVYWKAFGTNFFLDDKKQPLPTKLFIWQYKRL